MPIHYLWRRDLSKYTLKSFDSANELVCDINNSDHVTIDLNGTQVVIADAVNINSLLNGTQNIISGATKLAEFSINGTTVHAGTVGWTNPEAGQIIVEQVVVYGSTSASAAGALDVGTTATSSTTSSDNLIDGLALHTAVPFVGNNITDTGSNGKSRQTIASGAFVTFTDDGSGNTSGFVGTAYIQYVIV